MNNYDVLIIGAATSGAYIAELLAKKGKSVLVIEKESKERVARRLDIFHIGGADFKKYNLPRPVKGDPDWGFEFEGGWTVSPYDNYPKHNGGVTVGLHLHEYVLRLSALAEKAGARIEYETEFTDFIRDNDGKPVGARCVCNGKESEYSARVIIDCSGAGAAVRTRLPSDSPISNRKLSEKEVFYVILRYAKYKNPKDFIVTSRGWPYYKTWEAPQPDPEGSILGVGANFSYDYAEKIYKEFEASIKLPEREITRIERGITPFALSPYSVVDDGVVICGDAACMTKPNNGEGVTSSMVEMKIAADVISDALNSEGYLTKEKLWKINVVYNRGQGAEFVFMRPILLKAIVAKKDEFEFFFKKDIIFSEKFLNGTVDGGIDFGLKDIFQMIAHILGGLFSGKVSFGMLKNLVSGVMIGGKLQKMYKNFPETPEAYPDWKEKADAVWKKVN